MVQTAIASTQSCILLFVSLLVSWEQQEVLVGYPQQRPPLSPLSAIFLRSKQSEQRLAWRKTAENTCIAHSVSLPLSLLNVCAIWVDKCTINTSVIWPKRPCRFFVLVGLKKKRVIGFILDSFFWYSIFRHTYSEKKNVFFIVLLWIVLPRPSFKVSTLSTRPSKHEMTNSPF